MDIHDCSVDKVFAFIQGSYSFVYFWQALSWAYYFFLQIIEEQHKMAHFLRDIQEMGSHAVDIYDYLLAGFGEWAGQT